MDALNPCPLDAGTELRVYFRTIAGRPAWFDLTLRGAVLFDARLFQGLVDVVSPGHRTTRQRYYHIRHIARAFMQEGPWAL